MTATFFASWLLHLFVSFFVWSTVIVHAQFNPNSACTCPNMTTFGKDVVRGELKSPRYPNPYCADLRCSFAIKEGRLGTGIRLQFDAFNTEGNNADKLDIYYVKGDTVQKLARHSGTYQSTTMPTYTITDGGLEVVFATDSSVQRTGFLAHFTRFNVSEQECSCPGFLHWAGPTATDILSPNYPKSYCHNIRCSYLIKTRPPKSINLVIKKTDFETESRYDTLSIFDGNDTLSQTALKTLSGNLSENVNITSRGPMLMLVFRSDGDTRHPGFRLSVKEALGPCHCTNQTLSFPEKSWFVSPGFKNVSYCAGMDCNWSLSVKPEKQQVLQVQFPVFNLSTSQSDYVGLYSDSWPFPIRKFRGQQAKGAIMKTFTFDSSTGIVKMKTNINSNGAEGFNATFRGVSRARGCKCPSSNPQNLTSAEGTLRQSACGPLDCFYVLYPPPQMTDSRLITISLNSIKIHNKADYLIISKGFFKDNESPDVVRTFQGTAQNVDAITISTGRRPSGNQRPIMVHLHVQEKHETVSSSGFNLKYQWHKQVCDCGELKLGANTTKKTLTSPGFPTPYCDNMNCKWELTAPTGQRVVVNITELLTEAGSHDNVGIYDGSTSDSKARLAMLNDDLNKYELKVFRSNGTKMFIWFTSDGSVVKKGWNLTYYSEPNVKTTTMNPMVSPGFFQPISGYPPIQCPTSPPPDSTDAAVAQSPIRVLFNSRSNDYAFAAGFGVGFLAAALLILIILLCLRNFGRIQRFTRPTMIYKRHNGTENIEYINTGSID